LNDPPCGSWWQLAHVWNAGLVCDAGWTWQEAQVTVACSPFKGNAVREWSILVVRHAAVVWQLLHAPANCPRWGSVWQFAHDPKGTLP
jgi:hypothetical protein